MLTAENLKRLFRTYVYADGRFSPDVHPRHQSLGLTARRLDSGEMPVIHTSSSRHAPLGIANHIGRRLADRRAVFLIWFSWSVQSPRAVRMLSTAVAIYRRRRPQHRIILLCNEEAERSALAAQGAEAVLCNHNAFVDEEIFRPMPQIPRTFDAIHNGAMVPWKRHSLARLIPHCAHIFYRKSELSPDQTLAYLRDLQAQMPHHTFINEVAAGEIKMISAPEVNSWLSLGRCGLCLSAEEGAMYASVEYLLAGLPVVSTPNKGGRDEFSDPRFWLTVPDTAEAVRDGVFEMAGRNVPPDIIRRSTLERMYEHRAKLRTIVAEATDGKVLLPADLADAVYRGVPVWTSGSALADQLGLEA